MAEELLEAVISAPRSTDEPDQLTSRASGLGEPSPRPSPDKNNNQASQGKPAEGISADKRPYAALPSTAEYLHAHSPRIEQATSEGRRLADVTALISESPATLRAELIRALESNGAVDNQGEVSLERCALPASVSKASRMLVSAIAVALEEMPKADLTGQLALKYTSAEELARKAVEGRGS